MAQRRRPPIDLPTPGGAARDAPVAGTSTTRPLGEHPAWRVLRGLLALVTWAAMGTLLVTGVWLWLEYGPVPEDATVTLTDHQEQVRTVQDVHTLATWALGFGGALWLAAIAATSATSRRIVATGALLALLGGGAAVWTGTLLPWDAYATIRTEVGIASGEVTGPAEVELPVDDGVGILGPEGAGPLPVDGEARSVGTQEALAWGHVLGATLVLIGIGTAAGLARARRRRPDDDALPASRGRRGETHRLTLPTDVDAPPGWRTTGGSGAPSGPPGPGSPDRPAPPGGSPRSPRPGGPDPSGGRSGPDQP